MDEMHALGALFNGYLLEILISKVLYLEKRISDFTSINDVAVKNRIGDRICNEGFDRDSGQGQGSGSGSGQSLLNPIRIQLIAMSATVGNVNELAKWFGGTEPFISDYRPVVLFEKIVAGSQCCNRKGSVILEKLPFREIKDGRG